MTQASDIANPFVERKEFAWPHGTFARVARRLRPKVTPQHVRLVALGRATSARVERALERERERLESVAAGTAA